MLVDKVVFEPFFPFFQCVREAYHSTLREVIQELGWQVLFDTETVMKFISKDDALKFDVE